MKNGVQFYKWEEFLVLSPNQVNEYLGTVLETEKCFAMISQPNEWTPGYSFGNEKGFAVIFQ